MQLEAAKLAFHNRYQPDAFVVADDVATLIAHDAGGPDWNSEDTEMKAAARDRGKRAAHDEIRWQIDHILEVASNVTD